ncbi:hypothetical protein K501DRAFT_275789 [Backusella circina FSU 941]|nr:hypothetical protein K501DRAFT_275789 [Backusella circina FSU 941]
MLVSCPDSKVRLVAVCACPGGSDMSVKVTGSAQETKVIQNAVRASLNSMIYTNSLDSFDLDFACFEEQFIKYKSFVDYFKSTWHRKKTLFSRAWRPSITFHTNNFIEFYHNILKTVYLGRSRDIRVDHLV